VLGFSVAKHGIVGLQNTAAFRVGNDDSFSAEREDDDIKFAKSSAFDGHADVFAANWNVNIRHGLAARNRQALPDIDLRKFHLIFDVIDDFTSDVQAGGAFDAFESGRGIDFHDLRSVFTF
jgi:hypothetical protein